MVASLGNGVPIEHALRGTAAHVSQQDAWFDIWREFIDICSLKVLDSER